MKPIASPNEIVVGRDGVLLSKSGSSAVFLPQVALENDWDRTEMLQNLCKKGGLPAECWKDKAQFQVFQADVFDERQFD
jgi:AMMECR1 domain-containing protein